MLQRPWQSEHVGAALANAQPVGLVHTASAYCPKPPSPAFLSSLSLHICTTPGAHPDPIVVQHDILAADEHISIPAVLATLLSIIGVDTGMNRVDR